MACPAVPSSTRITSTTTRIIPRVHRVGIASRYPTTSQITPRMITMPPVDSTWASRTDFTAHPPDSSADAPMDTTRRAIGLRSLDWHVHAITGRRRLRHAPFLGQTSGPGNIRQRLRRQGWGRGEFPPGFTDLGVTAAVAAVSAEDSQSASVRMSSRLTTPHRIPSMCWCRVSDRGDMVIHTLSLQVRLRHRPVDPRAVPPGLSCRKSVSLFGNAHPLRFESLVRVGTAWEDRDG
jgi:hypothetical protein